MHEMFTVHEDLTDKQELGDAVAKATKHLSGTLEDVYGEEDAWLFIERQGLEISFKVIEYKQEMIDGYVITLTMKLGGKNGATIV